MIDITCSELSQNLRELDQYKNSLLASVTHDLKTPLNCINSFIEVMMVELSSNKGQNAENFLEYL
jgi:K+-sensing histidine kinase KdpD